MYSFFAPVKAKNKSITSNMTIKTSAKTASIRFNDITAPPGSMLSAQTKKLYK